MKYIEGRRIGRCRWEKERKGNGKGDWSNVIFRWGKGYGNIIKENDGDEGGKGI